MPWLFKQLFDERAIRWQVLRRGLVWTLVVASIIGLGSVFTHRENREIALSRARDGFQKELATHLWVTQQGGVYAPLDNRTPVDPYMKGLPDGEITTTTGKVLTLVNPIRMTRLLHELGKSAAGLQGHFTSRRPLDPENVADAWEQKALQQFETGSREYWEEVSPAGRPQLRFMGALMVVEDCLRCHRAQGYRVGDVRGGISMTVPLAPGASLFGGVQNLTITLSLGVLWLLGLWIILVAGRRNLDQSRERARSEGALRQKERYQRALLNNFPFMVWLKDTEGRFLSVNTEYASAVGATTPDALAGKTDLDVWPVDLAEGYRTDDHAVMDLRQRVNLEEEVMIEGTSTWCETYKAPVIDEDGALLGTVGFARDITARKRSEMARIEAEHHYRALFQANPHPMWAYDTRTLRFLAVNDAAVRHYGYSEDEFLAMTIMDIRPAEDVSRLQAFIPRMPDRGISASQNWRHQKKDGSLIEVEITSHGYDFGGQSARVVMANDVTERKRAEAENAKLEAQLQQTQKMESLGRLAGGVAHDMNNVLGAILGLASLHLDTQPEGSPLRRALDTIAKAAVRGGTMVKGLLNFARQSPAEELVLEVNTMLQEVVGLLERTTLAKIHLELCLAPDLQPICGDASALTHAFMNLCVNAVDAMPDSGTLTLRTQNVDDTWIEVMVEDTGTGMPKEVLAKAMDPFFTTKAAGKGTGLGLSMVYSTVKAHRGWMEILSEPGRGTQVRLRFPAHQGMAEPPEAPHESRSEEPHPESLRRHLHVLLVDDDDLVQSSLMAILEALGHGVTAVFSGEEALAKLETGFQPDVVILDMNMPGLGGAGTLPRLRALLPTVPVLLSTGRTDQAALDLVAAHPQVSLLPKPFGLSELRERLEPLV